MPPEFVDKNNNWLAWLCVVCGWLLCAFLCLGLTVELEAYPVAYDTLFPAILVILFGNIFVFIFLVNRWGASLRALMGATIRLCVGEALILACLYCLGRFAFGG
ncbi:MAG: hypothetical protein HDQ93_04080 [Desulfovibrio sp.]|nr:hypothetical protein [Desulfovibrio sp.]